jgi:intein/homing endonuclease
MNCNGDIYIKRSRDKNNKFCSASCVGKFRKVSEMTSCGYCNKEFLKSSKTKNLFCSKNCSNKSRSIHYVKICEKCEKEFTINNISEINRGHGKYCSNSCSSRKYKINEHFFEQIDSEEKAYILGFIYADGCVSKKGYELIIKLNNKDKIILEKIKNLLESDHPIKEIKKYNQSEFRIGSKKICNDLLNHGVTSAKTFKIEFPKISKSLKWHFIRGFFDGDGCISKIKNRNSHNITIFTASKNFMEKLVENLNEIEILSFVYVRNNGFAISFNKNEDILKFKEVIYKNSNIYLERKKSKFP